MTERLQPFWWFIGFTEGELDVRVFNMVVDDISYIEGALVEIIQDSTVIKSGYTDANGKYTTVLGAGTYTIRISKTGWQTIEKTETLAYPTELMVNLPTGYPSPYISGIGAISTLGAFPNPTITATASVEQNVASATNTISESVSVTVT